MNTFKAIKLVSRNENKAVHNWVLVCLAIVSYHTMKTRLSTIIVLVWLAIVSYHTMKIRQCIIGPIWVSLRLYCGWENILRKVVLCSKICCQGAVSFQMKTVICDLWENGMNLQG
jgi:hypothetical protein